MSNPGACQNGDDVCAMGFPSAAAENDGSVPFSGFDEQSAQENEWAPSPFVVEPKLPHGIAQILPCVVVAKDFREQR